MYILSAKQKKNRRMKIITRNIIQSSSPKQIQNDREPELIFVQITIKINIINESKNRINFIYVMIYYSRA